MTDVFVLRRFDPPLHEDGFQRMSRDAAGCLALYRVEWRQSCLSADGRRLLCRFSAPDAESTRLALRQAGERNAEVWPGTVHDAPGPDAPPAEAANVLVERRFAAPVTLEEIQSIEDQGAWCLEAHRVRFARTFFSSDRRRMLCLYQAPDAESVRLAQRQAGMPLDAIWAFRLLRP